jgi:hypothetical protein
VAPRHHGRIEVADLDGIDAQPAYVEFTHPLCSECHEWERRLGTEPDGAVLERLAP